MVIIFQWIFAHLLADFVLQTGKMVQHKKKLKTASWFLYVHCLLHAGLVYLFSPDKSIFIIPLVVFITHYFIDLWKLNRKDTAAAFIIDQVLHITVLFILWIIYYVPHNDWQPAIERLLNNTAFWLITSGYIFIIFPLSFILGFATARWREDAETELNRTTGSLKEAGKWIGIFERILVFTFVITGHFEGIGFLIAAKSILRFSDMKGIQARKEAEYVLIGTLISFSASILTGLAVKLLI